MLDLLIGGGALLLVHGLAAAGHGDSTLIVLHRGAELPIGGLILRLALGAIPWAALGLQLRRVAGLHVCLALSVTHLP